MSIIRVEGFSGVAPKIGAAVLRPNQAQVAKNVVLTSGELRPLWGLAYPTALTKTGHIKRIWRYNANTDWLHWTQDVDVVSAPVKNDTLERIYFTGTDKPRVTTKDLYDDGSPGTDVPPASYILGIPAPDTAPTASDVGAGNITGTVDYVFTFVRKWSDGLVDEGPPSPVSNSLTLTGRQTSVTLPNGSMTNPNDYGITHKRLYRLNGEKRFLVVEVTIGTASTTDNVAAANLGGAIMTTNYLPPPDEMIGIVLLANGVTAGYKDNVVYLSEPYRPWAYPLANQYTMGYPIVALGVVGTTLIVATTGNPYIGRGVDPAAYAFQKVEAFYPCVSKRSLASGQGGVFWATHDGIALADESGVVLATRALMTRREWARFNPSTMHGIVWQNAYYAWYETEGEDENGNKAGHGIIFNPSEHAVLTMMSDYVEAAHVVRESGRLWVVRKIAGANKAWLFDANPASPKQYEWRSKKFIGKGLENFSHAQVLGRFGGGLTDEQIEDLLGQIEAIKAFNAAQDTNGTLNTLPLNESTLNGDTVLLDVPSIDITSGSITFQYFADGVLKLTRRVHAQEPFPLPSGFLAETHEFVLAGLVDVMQVALATSVEELGAA